MKISLQPPNSAYCVPYGIKMVLDYYNEKIGINKIIEGCKADYNTGTTIEDSAKYLKSIGYKYFRIGFDYKSIIRWVDLKVPIVFSYINDLGESHFSVINGYFTKRKREIEYVQLADPYYGKISLPYTILKMLWSADDCWTRIIIPIKKKRKR